MKIGFDVAFGEFAQPLQGAAMILGGGLIVAASLASMVGNFETTTIDGLMDLAKYGSLAAIAVGFLTEPKVIKPGDKDYDRAKWREERGDFGYQAPSEKALEKFLIG